MAVRTRDQLKSFFTTGAKPLQAQFFDWIDSFRHINEKIGVADLDPTLAALIDALPTADAIAALTATKADLVGGKLKDSQVPDYLLSSSLSLSADGSFVVPGGDLLEYLVITPTADCQISVGTLNGGDNLLEQQPIPGGKPTVCSILQMWAADQPVFITGITSNTNIKIFKRR